MPNAIKAAAPSSPTVVGVSVGPVGDDVGVVVGVDDASVSLLNLVIS